MVPVATKCYRLDGVSFNNDFDPADSGGETATRLSSDQDLHRQSLDGMAVYDNNIPVGRWFYGEPLGYNTVVGKVKMRSRLHRLTVLAGIICSTIRAAHYSPK